MIKEGCDLGIDKHPQLIAGLANYKSIYESEEVKNMVLNELKRMKQAGLIEFVEIDPIGCAPLGAVPKADGKVRIIVDCTANGLNQRLNDCIRDMPMQLPTIRQAIKQWGVTDGWQKFNLQSGCQLIPVHKDFVE